MTGYPPRHTPEERAACKALALAMWEDRGLSRTAIGRHFGVSGQTITNWLGYPMRGRDLSPAEALKRARLTATLRKLHKLPQIRSLADLGLLVGATRKWLRGRLTAMDKLDSLEQTFRERKQAAARLRMHQKAQLAKRQARFPLNSVEIHRYIGHPDQVRAAFGSMAAFRAATELPQIRRMA